MAIAKVFNECPICREAWPTRDAFIADPMVTIEGYQADFEDLESGLFYFTHAKADCNSIMVMEAERFVDLYTGEKYSGRKTGSDECPGYCLDKDRLDPCEASCECAYVREVVRIIRK